MPFSLQSQQKKQRFKPQKSQEEPSDDFEPESESESFEIEDQAWSGWEVELKFKQKADSRKYEPLAEILHTILKKPSNFENLFLHDQKIADRISS